MHRVVVHSHVDADGVLKVEVPVGASDAERFVQVTIDPVSRPVTREEWKQFILATAGSISDPSFVRHPQGDHEDREPLPH